MAAKSSTAKKRTAARSTPQRTAKSLYSVHPSVAMVQNWIATLKEKSGKSLEEWLSLIKKKGPADDNACREWLKKEFGFGTNTCWWLCDRERGRGEEDGDPDKYLAAAEKYVGAMYAGPKAELKPLHDSLVQECLRLGKDVKICPCQTIVPAFRHHVIAQIKLSTRTRIDFGLALRDTKPKGKLIDTGGFAKKDRITHRIAVSSLKDIDEELRRWLKAAYELDAKG